MISSSSRGNRKCGAQVKDKNQKVQIGGLEHGGGWLSAVNVGEEEKVWFWAGVPT